jgi:hypothetical protein
MAVSPAAGAFTALLGLCCSYANAAPESGARVLTSSQSGVTIAATPAATSGGTATKSVGTATSTATTRGTTSATPGTASIRAPVSAIEQKVGRDTTEMSDRDLSSGANEVAVLTGILPIYEQLKTEQSQARARGSSAPDNMRRIQRIVYLHAKINQYLHTATLEVNSLVGRLNSGLAQLADRKAVISDERARMLRKNTTINLVSGGLTKIGGYTSALSTPMAIPTNVLEVFDGAVQVGLSAMNMKQQQAEQELSRTKPAILTAFLNNNNDQSKHYPESVWRYLTETSSGKSRRQLLLAQWTASGRLTSGAHRRRTTAVQGGPTVVRMDDLDDMTAMMSDIKSVVSGMEGGLMQLSEVLRDSYNNDPEI